MDKAYVHGYDGREIRRLQDQANTLVELLHFDTVYQAGSRILEAGCGVGAQTVTLARNSPKASFTSIDISKESIDEAKNAVEYAGFSNVQFQQADIFDLNFEAESNVFGIFSVFENQFYLNPNIANRLTRLVPRRH
jgi:ubiquinone/menaquinone biosynthesis C-methylase UbiE